MTVAERGCQSSSSRSTAQPNGSNREGSANLILEGGLRTVLLASLDPLKSFSLFTGFYTSYTLLQISIFFLFLSNIVVSHVITVKEIPGFSSLFC